MVSEFDGDDKLNQLHQLRMEPIHQITEYVLALLIVSVSLSILITAVAHVAKLVILTLCINTKNVI